MRETLFDKGRMKYQNVNKLDKKTEHARVNFTTLVHKINRKEMILWNLNSTN